MPSPPSSETSGARTRGREVLGLYFPRMTGNGMKASCGNRVFQGRSFPMICLALLRWIIPSTGVGVCFLLAVLAPGQNIPLHPASANEGSPKPPAIVIGFLGGFIARDNPVHSEVQLAARLRKEYPAGVDVETFESYRGAKARQKILDLLDADHDGTLSLEEKQDARIILYGHSWGGSEIITLARKLKKDGIPVLLTIQVDSVSKIGQNNKVIPTNVAQAANFYQTSGILHGKREIRPADPAHTRIIGNFRFDYKASPFTCNKFPWFDRLLEKNHIQIECDPKVWDQVESLIRSNIILADSPSEFR